MTMTASVKEVDYISNRIETHAVTYHTVSRDLKLSSARSKRLLAEYYNLNKSRLCASFVASGQQDGVFVIRRFETEHDLEENISFFDHLSTVHVYSIQLEKNSITSVDIALEELQHPTELDSIIQLHQLGMIRGPSVERLTSTLKQTLLGPRANDDVTKTDLSIKLENKKKSEAKSKSTLIYLSRKPEVKSSLISGYVSRKGESAKVANRPSDQPKKSYQYKSRKAEQSEPKERVVVSNVEDEEEEHDRKIHGAQPSTASTDLNNLFLDDDFTDNEGEVKGDEEETQPIAVDVEEESPSASTVSAPTVPEDSILRSFASNSVTKDLPLVEPSVVPSLPQETTVDQDGYFTLYKSSEVESQKPPLKKAKLESHKPANSKGDTKKKQTSLMSFFGKR